MKANRKARRKSQASSPDGGQMLLLAGFVISATAIVAIGTYTALQTGSTEVTERANRPLLDLFLNTRERAIDFFDLVTTNDTAISVEQNLDDYLFSQYQTARSLSIELNASLAGAGTDAPEKECLVFSEVTSSSACSTPSNANYVSRVDGPLWSDDGQECYSSLTYDGSNDGIITDANDKVVGAIFWLKVEGVDTSLEEYVLIDVPETEVSGTCYPWEASWSDSSTGSANLHDVDGTFEDAYAVGDSATIRQKSSGWSTVSDPFSGTPDLRGSDVTDDGKRLWFVGASGSVGSLKIDSGADTTDNSSALGVSTTLNDVAVTGDVGDANIYAADDQGSVHFSFDDGATWDQFTLSSGVSVKAIDFHDDKQGFAIDANHDVWETTDGETWSTLSRQPSTNGAIFGLDANDAHEVWVSGVGEVLEWNGTHWLTDDTDPPFSGENLRDIEIEHGAGHVVGDSGEIYHYNGDTWTDENPGSVPDNNLRGTTLVDNAIAVGDSGTIGET